MHWLLEFVCSFVFEYYVEIGSLLLLTLITIFRRELSINDEYRVSKHDDDGSNSIGHSADPAYYQINGTVMENSSEMSMANEGDEIALLEEENENSQIGMSHTTESNTSDDGQYYHQLLHRSISLLLFISYKSAPCQGQLG
mgnify:CR=1 FL=1